MGFPAAPVWGSSAAESMALFGVPRYFSAYVNRPTPLQTKITGLHFINH